MAMNSQAGKNHKKVAENIRQLVIEPFSKWSDAHEDRVMNSHDELQSQIKAYDKQHEVVKKLRSHYFNRCRLVEDMEEETKFIHVPRPETPQSAGPAAPAIKLTVDEEEAEDEDPLEIGDDYMPPAEVKKILGHMVSTIPQGEIKVAILGTYQNCSTGEAIVEFIQKNMGATSISYAERIGQDLVTHGFLRLVGQVGNTFANSSKMNYQWRPKTFEWAGVKPKPADPSIRRAPTIHMNGKPDSGTATPTNTSSPTTTAAIGDYLGSLLTNSHPGETQPQRLKREAAEADEKYKAGVRKLDLMRCELEESMVDHLKFMERCELDRLKAIKAVILDFTGAISNVVPAIQASVDRMMLYQETVQPLGDLRYLLESYRTGSFIPKVITYESYYNSADDQTFGVDLEARARADRKRVPVIVTSILTYLDHHYPDLEGDEARRGIWLVDVPLAATHHLRNAINNGKAPSTEVLEKYDVPIVASVLKLYLLELPGESHPPLSRILLTSLDSIVSSAKYEIFKTVYTTHGSATPTSTSRRLSVIQNTLGSLPLTNIATLDAITTHFTRLIELTSADESFISTLSHLLTNCILRPRFESSLTLHERHSYRLVRDLLDNKERIFGELKRQSSSASSHNPSSIAPTGRPRAVSTDESSRRQNTEARNRAIISTAKSRSSSPQPPRHRGAGSIDAGGTRFPIATSASPTTSPRNSRAGTGTYKLRDSLEVPGASPPPPPPAAPSLGGSEGGIDASQLADSLARHSKLQESESTTVEGTVAASTEPSVDGVNRQSSLGRSGRVTGRPLGRSAGGLGRSSVVMKGGHEQGERKRDSVGSVGSFEKGADGEEEGEVVRGRGVTLTDRPMED